MIKRWLSDPSFKKQGWNLADVSTRCSGLLQGESNW